MPDPATPSNASEPDQPGSGLQDISADAVTYGSYAAAIPKQAGEFVQTGRGDVNCRFIRANGSSFWIERLSMVPKTVQYLTYTSDWIALKVPLLCQDDYVINGRVCRPLTGYFSSFEHGYSISAGRRDLINVLLDSKALAFACSELSGRDIGSRDFSGLAVSLDNPTGTRLRALLFSALQQAAVNQVDFGTGTLRGGIEDEILVTLAYLVLAQLDKGAVNDRAAADAIRAVRRAERLVRLAPDRSPTMRELCDAAALGHTRLHEFFRLIYGTSPGRYAKLYRINLAFERLRDSTSPPRSVKDVALALGFTNSGRFSAEYRDLFGELPSETFERAAAERQSRIGLIRSSSLTS